MDPARSVLIIINLFIGFGFALPLTRHLLKIIDEWARFLRYFSLLIVLYFIESLALMLGMGIPVLNVLLAFIWGFLFARWFRNRLPWREALRTSFYLAMYSALPTASFILVPIMAWLGGWRILSAEDSFNFGIPDFLHLPWPVNTILGFYVVLVLGAIGLKILITMGEVNILLKHSHHDWARLDMEKE